MPCAQTCSHSHGACTSKELIPLVIDLQEGFANDTVVIRLGRQVILGRDGVTTDYAIGRADSVTVEVAEGSARIAISIPTKFLTDEITLDIAKTTYLGLKILDDKLEYLVSDKMFQYF